MFVDIHMISILEWKMINIQRIDIHIMKKTKNYHVCSNWHTFILAKKDFQHSRKAKTLVKNYSYSACRHSHDARPSFRLSTSFSAIITLWQNVRKTSRLSVFTKCQIKIESVNSYAIPIFKRKITKIMFVDIQTKSIFS